MSAGAKRAPPRRPPAKGMVQVLVVVVVEGEGDAAPLRGRWMPRGDGKGCIAPSPPR